MIHDESLNAAVALVDRCRTSKLSLGALSESILGVCVQASLNNTTSNYDKLDGFDKKWQESLTADPIFGTKGGVVLTEADGEEHLYIPTCEHDATIDRAADTLSATVVNLTNFTRNTVSPTIEEVISAIENETNNIEGYSEDIEIVDVKLSEAWESNTVKALLNRFNGGVKQYGRDRIPAITLPNDYNPEFRTGSNSIDGIIGSILDEFDMTLVDVIGQIFNGNANAGIYDGNDYITANLNLLRAIVCQWLLDNPVEGSGIDGGTWGVLLNDLSMSYGSTAYAAYSDIMYGIEHDELFIEYDAYKRCVTLNGAVYDKWLDQGGTPEIILGAVYNNELDKIRFDYLLENGAKYTGIWGEHHALENASTVAKRNETIRTALFNALLVQIEKSESLPKNIPVFKLIEAAKKLVSSLHDYQLNDIAATVTDVVCDILYPHTHAKFFVNTINSIYTEGMTTDEVIMHARIEYLTAYVTGSITYKKEL